MAVTELDYMEYATDGAAQSAYVTNATGSEAVDQQNTSAYDTANSIKNNAASTNKGQTFTAGATGKLTKVRVWLDKVGAPSGNVVMTIYATSAGTMTGSPIDVGTATVACSSLSTSVPAFFDFTWSVANAASVVSGTVYGFNLTGSYAESSTNYARTGRSLSNAYVGGTAYYGETAPATNSYGTEDVVFDTYVTTYAFQSYSEATIKTQGSYSLKGVATTGALNKTLTRTIT